MATKLDIFKTHLADWLSAKGDRKKRGELAKEISRIAQVHLKSVSRSFNRVQLRDERKPENRGRKLIYTKDVDAALYDIWQAASCPSGENLHPIIPEYLAGYQQIKDWSHSKEATDKLLAMSLGTLKARVKSLRRKYGVNRGLSTTKPSSLKRIIPIFKGPWDKLGPGNGQLDTVAHCGSRLSGDFAYTVNYTDVALYWGARRAQWNKGQRATRDSLADIKKKLPFTWIMGHPDTGSEFINWVAKDWCDQNGIILTRSEPGHKNDNMYVEERNGHVVRKYLGWERLDANPGLVSLINDYYDVLDLYLNHFQAVRRTLSKERIGAKYHRVFEPRAQTPYKRLLAHPQIPATVKQAIRQEHEALNPLLLKKKLDMLEKRIFDYQRGKEQKIKAKTW